MSKKGFVLFACIFLLITCGACKGHEPYLKSAYLVYLAEKSGIGENKENNEVIDSLIDWGVIDKEDTNNLEEQLDYSYLSKTLNNLVENKQDYDYLKENNYVSKSIKENEPIYQEEAEELTDKIVSIINNRQIENSFHYELNKEVTENPKKSGDIYFNKESQSYKKLIEENGERKEVDASFEEVYSTYDLNESYEIDFSDAEVIPYEQEEASSYINLKYNLLANKNHIFYKDDFRISYTLYTSGIDVHISKELDKSTVYADLGIKNVKPAIQWSNEHGDLKNCYFNISFNTTEKLGSTIGKYKKYHFNFKEADASSFQNLLKSVIEPKTDEVEATFKICEIKTPIPNVPTAYLNLDLVLNFYVNGEVELLLTNSHSLGFETKNGQIRFIHDNNNDWDGIASANAKATIGINFNLEAVTFILADIELDGGVKATIKTTLHIFDSDFNQEDEEIQDSYSIVRNISENFENVKICGDVSFRWVFDIKLNTSKTKLYKMGFSRTFYLMDDDDQVFGNLHHIENGMFVEKCTYKSGSKKTSTANLTVSNSKITLSSYAEVINVNETYDIGIVSLPEGYYESDLRYSSENPLVASVSFKRITGVSTGSTKITVKTSDGKYSAYINILVSTG